MANRTIYWIAGLLVLFVGLAALPFYLKLWQQDFMIFLFINILVAVSYRLMTLTGEWSLIHAVLWGAGGYASALLAKDAGFSVWLSIPIAGLVTAGIALLLSYPLFRTKGFYFLIGSFAAGEAIRLSWNHFNVPFGGPRGISLIPSPELWIPGMGTYELWEAIPYYFLTLIVVSLCLWALYRLEHSRIGMTLHAIHWRDALAESVGVDTWRYKTLAFAVSAFFVGIAGALFTHYLGTVNPHQFEVAAMVYILVWVIVGGTHTFVGPIIGVAVLSIANEFLRDAEEWRPLIYGCILIMAMRFLPDGLESLPGKLRGLTSRGRARRGAGAAEAKAAATAEAQPVKTK